MKSTIKEQNTNPNKCAFGDKTLMAKKLCKKPREGLRLIMDLRVGDPHPQ